MIELDLEPIQDQRLVHVQEEPALEIALPQVFVQPELAVLRRGKLPHVESLAATIYRHSLERPGEGLGTDYQELVNEFQPFFTWAIACWDYVLSTEGCRFVLRNGIQKYGARGDYRAVTDKEFSRLVHGAFRACVLDFGNTLAGGTGRLSLSLWLRERCWPMILDTYRRLEDPLDPRQRTLTPYSYLRCVPYQFLNQFHDELVHTTVRQLPEMEWHALDAYFFHFYTDTASADSLGASLDDFLASLRQGLTTLLLKDRLVYCLLRQIERY